MMTNRSLLMLAALAAAAVLGAGCRGAAGAPYELQFFDTMTAHHEAAIELARVGVAKATRPELQDLARRVVEVQGLEVEQFKAWRAQWFPKRRKAVNMRLPGMADAVKQVDLRRLEKLTDAEFNAAFIEMLIPLHQGAVATAQEAVTRVQHSEVSLLARRIAMDQQAEIELMQRWIEEWKTAR